MPIYYHIFSDSLSAPPPNVQAPIPLAKPVPKEPAPIPQSILDAANQFTKALKSQAEALARAWNHLHGIFDGHSSNVRKSSDGSDDAGSRSVWDIEQSLSNMANFLRVIDEVSNILTYDPRHILKINLFSLC